MNKNVYIAIYKKYCGIGLLLEDAKSELEINLDNTNEGPIKFEDIKFFLGIPQKVKQVMLIQNEEDKFEE